MFLTGAKIYLREKLFWGYVHFKVTRYRVNSTSLLDVEKVRIRRDLSGEQN